MRCKKVSWFLTLLVVVALSATSACVKEIPLPAEERDAVAIAVTRAVGGDMDIMTLEKVSLVRTMPYLRIALKIIPDTTPKTRNALRTYIHGNAMAVIREVAQGSSLTGIGAIKVAYYVNFLAEPRQQSKGPERVRLLYSTSVQTEALSKHDVSTITDNQIAALVTHTVDEIRKLDLPN